MARVQLMELQIGAVGATEKALTDFGQDLMKRILPLVHEVRAKYGVEIAVVSGGGRVSNHRELMQVARQAAERAQATMKHGRPVVVANEETRQSIEWLTGGKSTPIQ